MTVWLASGLPPRVTVVLIEPAGIVRVTAVWFPAVTLSPVFTAVPAPPVVEAVKPLPTGTFVNV